ncbi:MAG: S41 family peptidase [Gammaproteobacteria bacterium]|nr:S41 family peptidase [Gammaproteobacteria bacterium]
MFNRASVLLVLATATLAACGGGGGDGGGSKEAEERLAVCGTEYQLNLVKSELDANYLWYDEIPDLDTSAYAEGDQLAALNTFVTDSVNDAITSRGKTFPYSYVTTIEAENAALNNAGYIGFGFSSQLNGPFATADGYQMREVFPGSPADAAGLVRGDTIIAIDGVSIRTLLDTDAFSEDPGPYGPREVGYEVDLTIRHVGGVEEVITVAKDNVTIPTVSYTTTMDAAGLKVGYIYFRSFLTPSTEELNTAFQQLAADGVTRLILDLRYNGGGLVSVANHLGNLIAGGAHSGKLWSTTRFNDKRSSENYNTGIATAADGLPIEQLVAITTGGTASASELVINSLRPYIDVATVGSTSYGKPVGQEAADICTNRLRAVSFETVNSLGEGEYYAGIVPTCAADDDLTEQLGSATEGSIAEALYYIENASCSPTVTKPGVPTPAATPDLSTSSYRDGWDLTLGGVR